MQAVRVVLPIAFLAGITAHAQVPLDSTARSAPRGFAIGLLDSTDAALTTAPTLAHALQARLPGVSVSLGEGLIGSSSRVWLRGPSSLLVNEPLLIIDGARTHGSTAGRIFTDRELPSRLEDIDMEMVERVEVLRGPAAAAIYGPSASKGVILVTTRRARPGPAQWTAFAEGGPSYEPTAFPANFGTTGISTANGATVEQCSLAQQAAGSCAPVLRQSWNPLENASPFRTGWASGAGLTASGSAGGVSYFAGANHTRAEGVYATDQSRATSARLSMAASPSASVDVRLTGGYRLDDLHHPGASWIPAGLFGETSDDPATRGYTRDFEHMLRLRRDEIVRRGNLALHASWEARPWLRTTAMLGYDRLDVKTDFTRREPMFDFPEPSGDTVTRINRSSDRPEARTATLDATAAYIAAGMDARSTVGFQYIRNDDHAWTYDATITGDPDFPGGSARSSMHMRGVSKAIYVQQQFGWRDRLFVTGSLRADSPRWGSVEMDNIVSRSIDVSYGAIDPASGRSSKWVNALRVRAAYGHGGDHPVVAIGGGPVSPIEDLGSNGEQGSEVEAGIDVSLLSNRVQAGVTAYRATTERGFAAIPDFMEFRRGNGASVRTSGVEGVIDARLLAWNSLEWNVGAIVSAHRNRIELMGSAPYVLNDQYFAAGGPIGEYRSAPYSYNDANGDRLLAPSEVTVLIAEFVPVGKAFPDYEAALRTEVNLGGRLHLSAVADRRAGRTLLNETAFLRCRTLCPEQNDPATSIEDQSRPVSRLAGTNFAYFEDASYTKLREVRLALTLPSRVARLGGASSARVTLVGRNLYTWTSYSGLDPEVTTARYDTVEASDDFYQPIPRSFLARLDLTW